MTRATETELSTLHAKVAQVLHEHLTDEDDYASPAMIAIAVKFLKDNSITASIADNQDMSELSASLAEKRAKRKLRVVE